MTRITPASQQPAQLRVIAVRAGRSLDSVYRKMRLPGAPAPVTHVATVPLYDSAAVIAFLRGEPYNGSEG